MVIAEEEQGRRRRRKIFIKGKTSGLLRRGKTEKEQKGKKSSVDSKKNEEGIKGKYLF